MKKDIEWFMEQMRSMTRVRDLDSRQESWYISEGALLEALSKLDEPEVLSQEWIDNHTACADTIAHYSEEDVPVVAVSDLEKLLVPKQGITGEQFVNYTMDNDLVVFEKDKLDAEVQRMIDETYKTMNEKPVIPKFVADLMEDYNDASIQSFLSDAFRNYREGRAERADTWITKNPADFVDAYRYGYTVEGKKYQIHFGNHKYAQRFNDKWLSSQITDKEFASTFTKEEIKKLENSDLYWDNFAEEVTE